MLNIEVKILAMAITNQFQAGLDHLIALEQRYAVKEKVLLDNLYLLPMILKK